MTSSIQVTKQNILQGKPPYTYSGKVLERGENYILLEARFTFEGKSMVDIPLSLGDRFLETYYSDRWYNIYEVRSAEDDRLKCWYCNVSYPAQISESQVIFRDLALDLFVYPDGRQLVLDEDEFATLDISSSDRLNALQGLQELQDTFVEKFAK